MFGSVNIASVMVESRGLYIRRHNEMVDRNRHHLGRIIDAIKFLGFYELPMRGHNETESSSNRGAFIDFLKYVATMDHQLREHLDIANVGRSKSKDKYTKRLLRLHVSNLFGAPEIRYSIMRFPISDETIRMLLAYRNWLWYFVI